jgi:2'-5' RNA ligase
MTSGQPEPTQRIFTAIPLTDDVREHVAGVERELSTALDGVRWVTAENLHVTLRFMGECTAGKAEELQIWMRKAALHLPSNLVVGGVGGFPSQASARVIWVGAKDTTSDIEKVYNILDKGAEKCGFGREGRKYRPHITLGRARRKPVRLPPELVERFAAEEVALEVTALVLFRSDLSNASAKYTEIARIGPPAGGER